ncbi:MAG: hypothetical protein HN337_02190 [Deltaproteobacteria bacterium]|nr:hypothetical protein [Deltaproteobacteria bacterium]
MQFLSWIADINIIIPEGIEGVVNVNFREIRVSDAMNAIIRANSLEYTIEGRVVRIGKDEQFKETGEDLKTETFRLRFAPAMEMLPKVQTLLTSRGSAVGDDRTNSLIIRELLSNIDNIRRFIEDVDVKDTQVLIESKILEATRAFSRSLGIQWGLNRGQDGWDFRFGGVQSVGQADSQRNLNVNMAPTAPTSGLLLGSFFKNTNLDIQLLAAEQRGDIYVISDPSVVTSNGKAANIRSGATLLIQGTGSVNIGTSGGTTASTGSSSLEEVETGVELTVTPQITIDDYVKLNIEAVTSTPDFSRAIQGIPVIVDNTATTTVLVKDGETTVIGGLSRYQDNLTKRSVPYLHKIPLLGNAFKSKDKRIENTELMVFIKPTIIRVQGTEPAQMRVREVERRREAMYIEPILNPKKDDEKEIKKEEMIRSQRGNKYSR